ncbi:DUF1435 family protein [Enterobacter hormaechei]
MLIRQSLRDYVVLPSWVALIIGVMLILVCLK